MLSTLAVSDVVVAQKNASQTMVQYISPVIYMTRFTRLCLSTGQSEPIPARYAADLIELLLASVR